MQPVTGGEGGENNENGADIVMGDASGKEALAFVVSVTVVSVAL